MLLARSLSSVYYFIISRFVISFVVFFVLLLLFICFSFSNTLFLQCQANRVLLHRQSFKQCFIRQWITFHRLLVLTFLIPSKCLPPELAKWRKKGWPEKVQKTSSEFFLNFMGGVLNLTVPLEVKNSDESFA